MELGSPSSDDAVTAARNWLSLALDGEGDLPRAWRLTTHNLRLCLVQTVIWANRDGLPPGEDIDALAASLAAPAPAHPLWPSMMRGLLTTLRGKWEDAPDLTELPSLESKLVDPTHELVLLVHDSGDRQGIADGETFMQSAFLMQWDDGMWMMAGFGEQPPEPGWPPTYHEGPIVLR